MNKHGRSFHSLTSVSDMKVGIQVNQDGALYAEPGRIGSIIGRRKIRRRR